MVNNKNHNINGGEEPGEKDSGIVGDSLETVQFSPRVDVDLAEHYKNMVRLRNDGSFRSKFGPFMEDGLKYHLAIHFLNHTEDLSNIAKVEQIKNASRFKRKLRNYAETTLGDLAEILEELPEEVVRKTAETSPAAELFEESTVESSPPDGDQSNSYQKEVAQIGPQVRKNLNDIYKNSVRLANNGKFRTNFGPFVEKAMKYHLSICLLLDSSLEDKIHQASYIDDPEAFEQKLEDYVNQVKFDLAQAYLNIPEEVSKKMGTKPMKERIFAEEGQHSPQSKQIENLTHLFDDADQHLIQNDNFADNDERYFDNIRKSMASEDPEDVMAPANRSQQFLETVFRAIDYQNTDNSDGIEHRLLREVQRAIDGDRVDPDEKIVSDMQKGRGPRRDQNVNETISEIHEAIENFETEEGQSEPIVEIKNVLKQAEFGGKRRPDIIDEVADITKKALEDGLEPGLERAILNNIKNSIKDYYNDLPGRTRQQL